MPSIKLEYGYSFYNNVEIQKFAKAMLKVLPENVDGLLSTGVSGNSIASAMLTLSKKPLFHYYIRKNNDKSHGGNCVGYHGCHNYAIVDDIVSTGTTIKKILTKAKKQKLRISCIITVLNYEVDRVYPIKDIPIITIQKRYK